jgi:pyruvate/2-oxoglutarate dehydrogenase complex dihydrolipoamide acyltransferase (E2) component
VTVQAGDPVAEIETSKAVQALPAPGSGVMLHGHTPGTECRPGDTIARLFTEDDTTLTVAARDERNAGKPASETAAAVRTRKLSRNQLSVAETVSASHRDIPEAFVVMRASIDPVLTRQQAAAADEPPAIGLLETLVMAVASLAKDYPECFGSLLDARTVRLPDGAHVGVTLDAGHGLFIPVVRSAEHRSAEDVADLLAAFRLQAVRGAFTERDLAAPNIVISWNYEANVSLVKPVIPPGVACVISVGGPRCELSRTESGQLLQKTVVNLGLAHDHRIVNGREAMGLLRGITAILGDEGRLKELAEK